MEALGEGFHGDVLEQQRTAAQADDGTITRFSLVSWYKDFLEDAGNVSECDEEEIAEAREEATNAFLDVDSSGNGWLTSEHYEALLEALGTTYCEEDHLPQLTAVEVGGRLSQAAFVGWTQGGYLRKRTKRRRRY